VAARCVLRENLPAEQMKAGRDRQDEVLATWLTGLQPVFAF
jgi:hypothetical protein